MRSINTRPHWTSFLHARRLLESLGDGNNVAVTDANIASLYHQMGDLDAGIRWLDASIRRLSGAGRRLHLAEMLIQRGGMRAESGQMPEAVASFREGIEAAAAAGDWKLYATGCNNLGEAYLLHRDYATAEPALLDAYRVRKLRHFPMGSFYCALGRLRLAQGDLVSASALLDRAVELASCPPLSRPSGRSIAPAAWSARRKDGCRRRWAIFVKLFAWPEPFAGRRPRPKPPASAPRVCSMKSPRLSSTLVTACTNRRAIPA